MTKVVSITRFSESPTNTWAYTVCGEPATVYQETMKALFGVPLRRDWVGQHLCRRVFGQPTYWFPARAYQELAGR